MTEQDLTALAYEHMADPWVDHARQLAEGFIHRGGEIEMLKVLLSEARAERDALKGQLEQFTQRDRDIEAAMKEWP